LSVRDTNTLLLTASKN